MIYKSYADTLQQQRINTQEQEALKLFIKEQKSPNEIYNKYASLYQPSNNLSYIPPTINYDKLKQNKLIRDEEQRLKEEHRNMKVQQYLQMKPQNLTNYSVLPKPIYKPSKLTSVNLAIN